MSEQLRERLRSARRVFVLTGAGVSAESGVPTFRGGGRSLVWKGLPFEVISSAGMVERDLPAVWEWFDYRLSALAHCRPNPAHLALAAWQERFETVTLATQNIDGLHAAAGSRGVLELHGNILTARCTRCGARADIRRLRQDERPPGCTECGDPMRPDVVLFGETLPTDVYYAAAEAASACELCFVVGTSAVVYPAAELPVIARRAGAYVVEVNPEPTPLTEVAHESLRGRAGEVIPKL